VPVNSHTNTDIHVYRLTSTLYKGSIKTTTIQPDIPSGREALIQVTLDAADSGTLYLNGTPTPETLTFSSSKHEVSSLLFTALAGVTSTTISGTMTIKMIDEAGADIQDLVYQRTVRGCYVPYGNKERLRLAGLASDWRAQLYLSEEIDIRNEDIVKINKESTQYVVSDCVTMNNWDGNPSHKEMILKE